MPPSLLPGWPRLRAAGVFIAAVLGLAFSSATAHAQNLLQNGSFESSTFTSSSAINQGYGYVAGSTPVTGDADHTASVPNWTWTPSGQSGGSTLLLNRTGGALGETAEAGTYYVSFGSGSPNSGGATSQNFTPVAGGLYQVSLWVLRVGSAQSVGAQVTIKNNTNGSTVTTVPIDLSAGALASNTWKQVTFTFTAPSTDLSFIFTDTTASGAADSTDIALDNVSITAASTLQKLTIYGTDAVAGSIDSNTDCSKDGGATWLPAYSASVTHPWGLISGTTRWISRVANMASAPTTSGSNPETLDFRIRFYAPSDLTNAQLIYYINPDNYGDIYLNGTKLNSSQIVGNNGVITTATITNANIVAGLNTIIVRLTDTGGLLGINYRVDVQGYATSGFQRLTAPPAVTNASSSLANGSYKAGTSVPIQMTFTNPVTVTGAPTLTLATGAINRIATYASGSGTTTLTFNYTVQAGDNSADLDYVSTSALALNGGTIISSAADAQAANLTLPSPGASGSLSANKALVIDTTAPTLSLPANVTATATSSAGATVNFSASASDNLSTPAITYSKNSGTTFALGTTTVNVTATDGAGNTTTGSFTVTVNPAVATITLTTPAYTYDGTAKPATATTSPAGLPVAFTYDGGSTSAPVNAGSHAVTAQVSQSWISGTTNGSFTIAKANATVAISNTTQSYDGTAKSVTVATTPANLTTSVTYNGSTTAPKAVGSYAVVATVTDPNYTGSASATLTIKDTTSPVLSLPGNLAAEATSASGATITFSATATDNVDGSVAVTLTPASGSTFPLGNTTVTATATDHAGNSATGNFTVTVRDTIAPVITLSAPSTTIANPSFESPVPPAGGLPWTYTIDGWTASQYASVGTASVSRMGGIFTGNKVPDGDQFGYLNSGSVSQTLATTIEAGKTYVFSAYLGRRVDYPQAMGRISLTTANGTVLASATNSSTQTAGTFALVQAVYTATAGDPNIGAALRIEIADIAQGQIDFDSVSLTNGFALDQNGNITAEAASAAGTAVTFVATATDAVSGDVAVTASPVSGSTFPIGTTPLTLSATDSAGNNATVTVNITVKDTTKPTLTLPSNITAEATSAAGAVVTFNPTATDAASTPTIVSTPASGSTFPLGTTTVNVTATDGSGLQVTGSFNVTVVDTTKPVLTLPANITAEATSAAGAVVTFAPTATDTASTPTIVSAPASGSTFPLGTTTVNVTATDGAGLQVTGSFNVTVIDTTKPVLTLPADITAGATSAAGAVVDFAATATDATSTPTITYSKNPGTTFPIGATTVSVTATDAAGNQATGSFIVNVTDTIAPETTIAGTPTALTNSASATFAFTGTDIGSGVASFQVQLDGGAFTTATSPLTLTGLADGTHTFRVRAIDAVGNIDATPATYTWTVDTTPPVITAASASGSYKAAFATTIVANETPVTFAASGLPAGLVINPTTGKISGTPTQSGAFTVALSATDAAGNTGHGTLALTIAQVNLTVAGITAADKVYDATTTATLNVTGASLAGIIGDDNVTLNTSAVAGTFANKNVGTAKLVTISGLTLAGADAANYTFTAPTTTATITAKTITIAGAAAANKVYDGATTASVSFAGASLVGVAGADDVTLVTSNATATFASAGVGVAKSVTIAGLALGGGDAPNYTLTVPTLAADITARPLTIAANAQTKVYGTTDPVLTYSVTGTLVASDALTGKLTRATGENVGTYAIALGSLSAGANYAITFKTADLTITPATATIALDKLVQNYDGQPKPVTVSTSPADLPVSITYNDSATVPTLPGSYYVVATITDPNYTGSASDTLIVTVTSLVRHASTLSGEIDGSLQVLSPESVTLNGSAMISGDLLVPGMPAVRLNGKPTFAGTVDATGAATPANYDVTLNGNAVLRKLVRRVDALTLPSVAAPAQPAGTRNVTLNKSTDLVGEWSTLRNLTLNGDAGQIAVPSGAYGNLTATGSNGFILGVAGSTERAVYDVQNLTVTGNATLKIVGPVTLTLANGLTLVGDAGDSAHPEWLTLRVASGGVTLNGGVDLAGDVIAPNGTVTLNGNTTLKGHVTADRLILNGNSLLTGPELQ
jgi:hypothetical protein